MSSSDARATPSAIAGHQRARVVERRHGAGKALLHVDLGAAEDVVLRHAAVLEQDGRRVRGADAHLLLEPRHAHAGRALLDHEGLDRRATRLGSSEAHTTTSSQRSPAVTKIFSPLSTQSSPSRRAVVRIAAESLPASGSVMAIEAHLPPKRCDLLGRGHRVDGRVAEALTGQRQAAGPRRPSTARWCRAGCDMLPPLRTLPSSLVALLLGLPVI